MYKTKFLILCIVVLFTLVNACGNKVEVGPIQLNPVDVKTGEQASVQVNIENPKGIPLDLRWKATRGKVPEEGGIYTAPIQPGPDLITLEVWSNGKMLAQKTVAVKVTGTDVNGPSNDTNVSHPAGWQIVNAPFDLTQYYIPSGYMHDGATPGVINMELASTEEPHTPPTCTKIIYNNIKEWGGVYYLFPANNWGDYPGLNIQGAKKVTFWARGVKGDEAVEFKAGGVNEVGKKYNDSFIAPRGIVSLTRNWKQYEINLSGQDTSRVIGAFLWVASREANPGKSSITFYLDDLQYEQ